MNKMFERASTSLAPPLTITTMLRICQNGASSLTRLSKDVA